MYLFGKGSQFHPGYCMLQDSWSSCCVSHQPPFLVIFIPKPVYFPLLPCQQLLHIYILCDYILQEYILYITSLLVMQYWKLSISKHFYYDNPQIAIKIARVV